MRSIVFSITIFLVVYQATSSPIYQCPGKNCRDKRYAGVLYNSEISMNCVGERCEVSMKNPGGDWVADCSRGNCRSRCLNGNCHARCPGGNCDLLRPSRGEEVCRGGSCRKRCPDGNCNVRCPGGNCEITIGCQGKNCNAFTKFGTRGVYSPVPKVSVISTSSYQWKTYHDASESPREGEHICRGPLCRPPAVAGNCPNC